MLPLAIVGNGAAAAEAVRALREHSYSGDIHLFADNDHAPYNPMLGTYLVAGAVDHERVFPFGAGRSFYDLHRVTAHLDTAVVSVDPAQQTLTTADGQSHRYALCLVATGARPSLPPVAGLREAVAAPEVPVFTIQSYSDATRLKRAVDDLRRGERGTGPRAAVVGASFAGVKTATTLHELGFRVTLVEREASILPLSAHPWCARILEEHLLSEGYELRLGASLAGVKTSAGGVKLDFGALPGVADVGGAAGTACEEAATLLEVDLVVACTGSRPALGFLEPGSVNAGLGILVDEGMRSSNPTLLAAGDVAQGRNLLSGRHEIIGLWSSARYQGRAAGRSMAASVAGMESAAGASSRALSGTVSGHRGNVPHNITHVGRRLFASIGCMTEYDSVTTCSEGEAHELRVWQDGRLAGVNLVDKGSGAGVVKQALLRAATGAVTEMEATWTNLSA